ncbi:MAG: metallophosphoesterase [Ignavibacteria bacterium]|nr:metallophosphoesterase [Ignavibacteria bacterium]
MKIAHISDLHLDAVNKKENLRNTLHLFEYINSNNYDHVIVSGDVTENGDSASFELARSTFKKFGLLHKDKLSLTIGNHDIYGGVFYAEDILNFPGKCRRTNYYQKVREFAYYFRETFYGSQQNDEYIFPYVKELDEILLCGINSIAFYSSLKNPFASNGKISTSNTDKLSRLLASCDPSAKKRIIVSHHHFNKSSGDDGASGSTIWQAIERQTMKLRNKKKIIKRYSELNAELVLHGHLHESREYQRKKLKFLNSGGSVLGDDNFLKLNEITISDNKISSRIVSIQKPGNTSSLQKKLLFPLNLKNEHVPQFCLN